MKNLIYSLAILIAIGLVGCGGGGSAASGTPASAASDTPASVVEEPALPENTTTKSPVAIALPAVPQIPAGN